MAFWYTAFGFTLSSSFEIPELDVADGEQASDFCVVLGEGPPPNPEAYRPSEIPPSTVVLGGPARSFRITQGRLVEVWESDPSARDSTRAALIGFAFSVVVYQRHQWPFHVGAVRNDNATWLFGGRSGAGKSTLVSWLHTHLGLPILTDDAAVLRMDDNRIRVTVASRAVRLLPESYEKTFQASGTLCHSVSTLPAIDRKVRVRIPPSHSGSNAPVSGLVILAEVEVGVAPTITRLRGAEAFQAIRTSLFRPWLGENMYSALDAVEICSALQQRLPVYRFARSRSFDLFAENHAPLLTLMQLNNVPETV